MTAMRAAVVLVAAGSGSRLGADRPKAFVDLCGEPILCHAVRGAFGDSRVHQVVVVAPPGSVDAVSAEYADNPRVLVVAGGQTRAQSVALGLAQVQMSPDAVLVHDAARCLTPAAVYSRVLDSIQRGSVAVVPGLPVVDTMKSVASAGEDEVVVSTVNRSALRAIQTPQGFRPDILLEAHRLGPSDATDDAAMAEAIGTPIHVVVGDPLAFKITGPLDLALAGAVLTAAGRSS